MSSVPRFRTKAKRMYSCHCSLQSTISKPLRRSVMTNVSLVK